VLKKVILASAVALSSAMVSAEITLDGWGTSAAVFSFDDCPSYCTGNIDSNEEGGVDQASSSAELNNIAGTGKSLAQVNGSGYTPVLKAQLSSNANRGMYANAWGIQHYVYTGTEETTLQLNLNLHGSVSGDGKIKGAVAVIKGDELPWTDDMATLIYELVDYQDVLAHDSLFISSGIDQTDSVSLEVALSPGDSFFVRADLLTNGKREGSVDAFNTFTMSFDDASQLQAATQPEQEESLSYAARSLLIKTLWEVAYEDDNFTRRERRIVRRAAKLLGLNKGDARLLKLEVKAEAAQ
jgi:hypothetical protein